MHSFYKEFDIVRMKNKEKCDSKCKYYEKKFEHNKKACTLSDVFSVNKGEPCSNFELKDKK